MGSTGRIRAADAAQWAISREDDRHGQSRHHLGEPLSPGWVEAIVPIDAHSGRDLGVRAQAHLYLPAIFPAFYGKPIFGK